MKKYLLLFLPLFCLLAGCRKELETKVDLEHRVQFTIPAGLNPYTVWELNIPNIQNNKLARLSAAGITDEEVVKIVGKVGLVSAVFSGIDYDFIQEFSVEIYSDDPEDSSEILYREQIPRNTKSSFGLNASLPNVKRHLEGDTFGILVRIIARNTAIQNVETNLEFTLGVL